MRDFARTVTLKRVHEICQIDPADNGYDSVLATDLYYAATLVGTARIQNSSPLRNAAVLFTSVLGRLTNHRLTGLPTSLPQLLAEKRRWADLEQVERAMQEIAINLWRDEAPAVIDDLIRVEVQRATANQSSLIVCRYDDQGTWDALPIWRNAVSTHPAAVADARSEAIAILLDFEVPLAVLLEDPSQTPSATDTKGAQVQQARTCQDALARLRSKLEEYYSHDDGDVFDSDTSASDRHAMLLTEVRFGLATLRPMLTPVLDKARCQGIDVLTCDQCLANKENWLDSVESCDVMVRCVINRLTKTLSQPPTVEESSKVGIPAERSVAGPCPVLAVALQEQTSSDSAKDDSCAAEAAWETFRIDASSRTVYMGDKSAVFGGRGSDLFDLLQRIARRPGHVVYFSTLHEPGEVWGERQVEKGSIRSTVTRLRQKLRGHGLDALAKRIRTAGGSAQPYVILAKQLNSTLESTGIEVKQPNQTEKQPSHTVKQPSQAEKRPSQPGKQPDQTEKQPK